MSYREWRLRLPLLPAVSLIFVASLFCSNFPASSQSTKNDANTNSRARQEQNPTDPKSPPIPATTDVIKVDIDLIKVDALVLQKNTARIVGGLKKEDFLLFEDGAKQEITHFSQDTLPLSVLVLIDRGGCLDPFRDELHRAAREAIHRLKPIDEIALMTFQIESTLVQPFTRNSMILEDALHRIPPHVGVAPHCLNNVLADAADYMMRASNPAGDA